MPSLALLVVTILISFGDETCYHSRYMVYMVTFNKSYLAPNVHSTDRTRDKMRIGIGSCVAVNVR